MWASSDTRLDIVPLATNNRVILAEPFSAASYHSRLADGRMSALARIIIAELGAARMASRISSVGIVMVCRFAGRSLRVASVADGILAQSADQVQNVNRREPNIAACLIFPT